MLLSTRNQPFESEASSISRLAAATVWGPDERHKRWSIAALGSQITAELFRVESLSDSRPGDPNSTILERIKNEAVSPSSPSCAGSQRLTDKFPAACYLGRRSLLLTSTFVCHHLLSMIGRADKGRRRGRDALRTLFVASPPTPTFPAFTREHIDILFESRGDSSGFQDFERRLALAASSVKDALIQTRYFSTYSGQLDTIPDLWDRLYMGFNYALRTVTSITSDPRLKSSEGAADSCFALAHRRLLDCWALEDMLILGLSICHLILIGCFPTRELDVGSLFAASTVKLETCVPLLADRCHLILVQQP